MFTPRLARPLESRPLLRSPTRRLRRTLDCCLEASMKWVTLQESSRFHAKTAERQNQRTRGKAGKAMMKQSQSVRKRRPSALSFATGALLACLVLGAGIQANAEEVK